MLIAVLFMVAGGKRQPQYPSLGGMTGNSSTHVVPCGSHSKHVAIENVKCSYSELRCAVSVKHTLDFKEKKREKKPFDIFYIDCMLK